MRSRFRPSAAMVVACIALFVALGGTATAVTYVVSSNSQIGPGTVSGHKPPTGKHANVIAGSVNATDLANGAVSGAKLAPNSVDGGKVVDGSLVAGDTDTTSIQKRLDSGCASGQAIASVDASGTSACTAIGFTQVTMRFSSGPTVSCQAGETVVGGGANSSIAAGLSTSEPLAAVTPGAQGWTAATEVGVGSLTTYALCAK